MNFDLVRHPSSPVQAITGVSVGLYRTGPARFVVDYAITGDIGTLALPPVMAQQRADNLWQTTCFEAFGRIAGRERYAEFNFSPSTQWAGYVFSGYRADRIDFPFVTLPRIDLRAGGDRLELSVVLEFEGTGDEWRSMDIALGLSAIVETRDRAKSYWALAHPPGEPDFHHGDCFAAFLRAPEAS